MKFELFQSSTSCEVFVSIDMRYVIRHTFPQTSRERWQPAIPESWSVNYVPAEYALYTSGGVDVASREVAEAWCEHHAKTAVIECMGCCKPIIRVKGDDTYSPVYVELPNGLKPAVCGKRHTAYTGERPKVDLACHRKLKLRWHFCQGCGAHTGTWKDREELNGSLCGVCQKRLLAGSTRTEERVVFAVGAVRVPNKLDIPLKRAGVDAWKLEGTFIKLANPEIPAKRTDSYARPKVEVGSDPALNFVELTQGQAEAMDALMKAFEKGIVAAYAEGHADGRNALMGLANGGLSVEDLMPEFARTKPEEDT